MQVMLVRISHGQRLTLRWSSLRRDESPALSGQERPEYAQ